MNELNIERFKIEENIIMEFIYHVHTILIILESFLGFYKMFKF